MSRKTYTHLMLGSAQTWCGKPAGFHRSLKATGDIERVDCPRCLKAKSSAVGSSGSIGVLPGGYIAGLLKRSDPTNPRGQ